LSNAYYSDDEFWEVEALLEEWSEFPDLMYLDDAARCADLHRTTLDRAIQRGALLPIERQPVAPRQRRSSITITKRRLAEYKVHG
jgi:hypothetical protein